MKHLLKIALADFKLIFRDPSLRAFLFFPLLLFVLIIWFLPGMIMKYEFLNPYVSIFMVVAVIENTQMFSFISSMVLIDEKETGVAKQYGIVPVSGPHFLLSRLLLPYLFTVALNIILLAVQPFYTINLYSIVLIAMLTGLIVPVYVLAINSFAESRVEGMVYIKAFNMLVLLPLAAFFVPEPYQPFFGILPTHWIFQSIERLCEQQAILPTVSVGMAFFAVLLLVFSKRFLTKHFI